MKRLTSEELKPFAKIHTRSLPAAMLRRMREQIEADAVSFGPIDDTTKIFYLAGPYSHPDPKVVEQRMDTLCKVDAKLTARGLHTVSPLLKHYIAHHEALPTDYKFWQAYAETLIRRCDGVIVVCMPGWEESIGVQAELELARSLGKEIIKVDENGQVIN